jgi:site-specific DNA recombinase
VRGATTEAKVPDAALVALLARAHRWFGALLSGRHESIMALAKVEGQGGRDITGTIYLAFLAPDIVERFVRGEQPIGLGVRRLMAMSPLPMDWGEQRRALGLT